MINSPFVRKSASVQQVMLKVLLALVPGIAAYVWFFGAGILVQLAIASAAALAGEAAMLAIRGKRLATGKILIIDKLLANRELVSVLILAPTRELAQQIDEEFRRFSSGMKLYSALAVGGQNIGRGAELYAGGEGNQYFSHNRGAERERTLVCLCRYGRREHVPPRLKRTDRSGDWQ